MSPILIFSYTALMGVCLCWDLDLVHVNDIHVRMEETNKHSAACGYGISFIFNNFNLE